jgi:hypothetical protein
MRPRPSYLLPVLLVLAPSACDAAGWADIRVVGPFVCRADFSLAGLTNVLDDLGRLQADLVRTLGVPPAAESVDLYFFHDQATYSRYLSRYLPTVPYRRALYVKSKGPGKVFAYWSRDFEVDLRHECTHALLHASLPVVPLWLDEGLAEYFQVPADQRAAAHPYLKAVRSQVRWSSVARPETLEKIAKVADLGHGEYQAAWAWVHFMLHGPAPAHEELVSFLADIRSGSPPGLLSARLRRRLADLDSVFTAHFRRRDSYAAP